MIKIKLFIGLAVAIGALLASVSPAFAEFESRLSESKGTGEIYESALEGGGATVTCQALEEGTSKVGWTVQSKEKASKSGSGLLIKIANWGKCQTKASGLKEAETKVGECEMEAKQAGEEAEAVTRLVKACAAKVGTCEIKIEPTSNKELKSLYLEEAGAGGDETAFTPDFATVVTEVGSECKTDGIAASKTATLAGRGQLASVRQGTLPKYETKSSKAIDKQTKLFLLGEKEAEVGGVDCAEADYTVGLKSAGTTIRVTPELLKCKAGIGKEAVAVKVLNECKEGLMLNQPETFEGGPEVHRSTVSLLKGCAINMEVGSCLIKIVGEQAGLGWAYYALLKEMTLEEPTTAFEIAGLTYGTSEGCKADGLPSSGKATLDSDMAPYWTVNNALLKEGESTSFTVAGGGTESLEVEGVGTLVSEEVTGTGSLIGGGPGTGTLNLIWHKVKMEGHPSCSVKSEGAAAQTMELAAKTEVTAQNVNEEPSKELFADYLVGTHETTIGTTTYKEVLATLEFSGECPAGIEAKMALAGSVAAAVGSYDPLNLEFQQPPVPRTPQAPPPYNPFAIDPRATIDFSPQRPTPSVWRYQPCIRRPWGRVTTVLGLDSVHIRWHGLVPHVDGAHFHFGWEW